MLMYRCNISQKSCAGLALSNNAITCISKLTGCQGDAPPPRPGHKGVMEDVKKCDLTLFLSQHKEYLQKHRWDQSRLTDQKAKIIRGRFKKKKENAPTVSRSSMNLEK